MISPTISSESEPSQEKLQELIAFYNQGRFEVVLSKIESLLNAFPESVFLFNLQGACNFSLNRNVAAVESYKQSIRIAPNYAEAHNNMGFALNSAGNLEEAIGSYRQAIKIEPDYAEAHLNLGVVLNNKQDLQAAIESYKQAVKIKPHFPEAYFNMGITFNIMGNLEAAIESYKKAIEIKPDYSEAYFNMANILSNAGKLDAAIESYKRVIDLKPEHAQAHLNMGIASKNKGNSEAAIESYQLAIKIKPDYAEAHYYKGNALSAKYNRIDRVEDLEAAIKSYESAIMINPDHFHAYEGMSFWIRHYIWARNSGLIMKVKSIDHLINLERDKLREKIAAHPFWFVDITRTSSTAIKVALGAKFGWPFGQNYYYDTTGKVVVSMLRSFLLPSHTPAFMVKHILGEELWTNIDTFTVVRNPYSWCSSLWHHAMKNHHLGLKTDTLDQFLGSIEEQLLGDFTKRRIFPSNYRQVDYILDTEGKVLVKNILKLESREKIDRFLKSKSISDYSKAPRFVETKSSNYRITNSEKKKINRIFAKDFEILGY